MLEALFEVGQRSKHYLKIWLKNEVCKNNIFVVVWNVFMFCGKFDFTHLEIHVHFGN